MVDFLDAYNITDYESKPMFVEDYSTADPNAQDEHGNTVLHAFMINYEGITNFKLLQEIINKGADLEIENGTGKTVFLMAVVHRRKKEIAKLIENGVNVHAKDNKGNNAFHLIAASGVNYHFETLYGPNDTTPENERVDFEDTFSVLTRLFEEGVDVNCMNDSRETPLMWAAQGYHLKIVEMLLKYGAKMDLQDEKLQTCLHKAATYEPEDLELWVERNPKIVSELIRRGACVNCFDNIGRTPLGYYLDSKDESRDYLVSEFIKAAALANWKRKTDFFITKTRVLGYLRSHALMKSHVVLCYNEILEMEFFHLPAGSTLSEFALRGVSDDERSNEYEICSAVLDILLVYTFPLYHDFILSSFEGRFWRQKIMEVHFSSKGEGRSIHLTPDDVYMIFRHMDSKDFYNTFVAEYLSRVPL